MGRVTVRVGEKHNRWTVLHTYINQKGGYRHAFCVCECGSFGDVRGACLKSGESKSCGCWQKETARDHCRTHGFSKHDLYDTHYKMIYRCTNPDAKDYKHYGERGIKVCDRWLQPAGKGFANFLEDMGERPEGYELGRIDVNGDYTLENCRWATRQEQMQNTRVNHIITFNGETRCLAEWAEILGIKRQILVDRLGKLNWTVEKTLTTLPIRKRKGIRHGQFRESYNGSSNTSRA